MDLAFRGTRANGAPAYQSRDVLWRDHVKKLSAGRHAHLGEIDQKVASLAQAVVNLVRLIEVGIVN
jgi:hypothetical protein